MKFKIKNLFVICVLCFVSFVPVYAQSIRTPPFFGGSIPSVGGGNTIPVDIPVYNKKEVGTGVNIPGIGSINLGKLGSLDGIFWEVGQLMLHQISNEVVRWIQGGGRNGGPLFITNWEDFLRDAANEASGIFIEEFELTELCQPFKPRIRALISIGDGSRSYRQRAQCTITDVARNVERFYRDFRQGGWEQWFQLTLVPQNNFYGAYYITLEEKLRRESAAVQAAQNTGIASGGFLGVELCAQTSVSGNCLKWETVSPGSIVESQLKKVFDAPIERLNVADEIDEILSAALKKLFTSLRQSQRGLISLSALPESESDLRQSIQTAQTQISGVLGLNNAIQQAQYVANAKQDTAALLASALSTLNTLQSCRQSHGQSFDDVTQAVASASSTLAQVNLDIEAQNDAVANLIAYENERAFEDPFEDNPQSLYEDFANLHFTTEEVGDANAAFAENQQAVALKKDVERELAECQSS